MKKADHQVDDDVGGHEHARRREIRCGKRANVPRVSPVRAGCGRRTGMVAWTMKRRDGGLAARPSSPRMSERSAPIIYSRRFRPQPIGSEQEPGANQVAAPGRGAREDEAEGLLGSARRPPDRIGLPSCTTDPTVKDQRCAGQAVQGRWYGVAEQDVVARGAARRARCGQVRAAVSWHPATARSRAASRTSGATVRNHHQDGGPLGAVVAHSPRRRANSATLPARRDDDGVGLVVNFTRARSPPPRSATNSRARPSAPSGHATVPGGDALGQRPRSARR